MGGTTPLPTPSTPGYTTFTDYLGRKWTSCVCLAEWLGLLQRVAIKRGHIKQGLDVWQLTGGATASAGTHSKGGAFDLLYQTSDSFVRMCREFGADATWKRTVSQGFSKDHTHGVLVGCEHNSPAYYQIVAQRDGYNGLGTNGRGGPDNYPDPNPRRTWKQGVTEMKRELGLLAKDTATTLDLQPDWNVALTETTCVAKTSLSAPGTHIYEWQTPSTGVWHEFRRVVTTNGSSATTWRFGSTHPVRVRFVPKDATAFKPSTSASVTTHGVNLETLWNKVAATEKACADQAAVIADLQARVAKLETPPA